MTSPLEPPSPPAHRISVVVPVYGGATTLGEVVSELEPWTDEFTTAAGHRAVVTEVLLVHDHGPDDSPTVMRTLAEKYSWVRTLWLSRNYGQHAATLAGMASSGGDWVVTMDEDGQHDPAYLGDLLDVAMAEQVAVVYAQPTNPPPHGALRNAASRGAKRVIEIALGGTDTSKYQSYRLVLGEIARSTAAFAGAGVYLDVALGWVAGEAGTAPVRSRQELGRESGYSTRRLLSHFWRMVLSSGTRGLRTVSFLGVTLAVVGAVFALALAVMRIAGNSLPAGWTSTIVVLLLTSGAILFSLGIIAEYVGVAVNMAMGKPAYLMVSDPDAGPLGRRPTRP
ncbi:glycosyltransferase [Cellulomonas fimi]|uniref:glycosyltransferase n=1 Tax=Cellulomonas fimi TaxID=1708 RepID=UPI00234D026D|nr:glycosyltransferase [Cellulomonas fimi]MDC7123249.1 glycosyltransferase [Cellulomonas fimi]